MTEISDRYRRLAAAFADTIAAVPDDRWASPSPCPDWTARDVVGHVVSTQAMFLGLVGREMPEGPTVEDDPAAAWAHASAIVHADLEVPDRAATTFEGFGGTTTFEAAVDRFLNFDLVVHRWDLARATGGDESIADAEAERVIAGVATFGDAIRNPQACGPEVSVDPGANLATRMLGLVGRQA